MTPTKAYDFTLQDQDGVTRSLHDYLGSSVVLYFYPKDDTPGCTKEACNFRDSFHEIESNGAVVIGISKDSVSSHKKFATKYDLKFPLLSDPDHNVIEKYSAWGEKKFMARLFLGILRMTYLIDPAGNIVKTYPKVNPTLHANEILSDLRGLTLKV